MRAGYANNPPLNLQCYTGSVPTKHFDFSKPSSQSRKQKTMPFPDWLGKVTPQFTWTWPYLQHIQEYLDQVTRHELNRLMLFVPPRHGKSEMVTVRYPVWRLEQDPELRVIIGAYNQILANKFSRKARRIAESRIALAHDRQAVEDWETPQGGGLRAIGVGAGITGQGGRLIVIDDPVKSREEAESESYRERVWDWYRDDLYTRLEPDGQVILIQTRWHEDDLAGRILASEDGPNWAVVTLPALAEPEDVLGRAVGAALCPERYDAEKLQSTKVVLGEYSFSALYQQRPGPREGSMFKRAAFEILPVAPAQIEAVTRYWDKAATAGSGDYSVGAKLGRKGGLYYVLDVVRGQWSTNEREQIMRQTAQLDGADVPTWLEQEPGSSGKDSAAASVRNLAGFAVYAEPVTGDKVVRAGPFAAQVEAGNVKLIKGPWNAAYLDELCAFPTGAHDDQVDASSGAFTKIADTTLTGQVFF